jgi:Domain of unknown function (DUF6378)
MSFKDGEMVIYSGEDDDDSLDGFVGVVIKSVNPWMESPYEYEVVALYDKKSGRNDGLWCLPISNLRLIRKFKPGDRVKKVNSSFAVSVPSGEIGTTIWSNPVYSLVEFDDIESPIDGDGWVIPHTALELVEETWVGETILEEAQRLVYGDRNNDYGHPYHDMSRTAKIWSAILGVEVEPLQVAMCMIGVKLSRQVNKSKRDNMVDIAGYAEVAQRIVDWDEDEDNTDN